MRAPIALIAAFVGIRANWTLLPIADGTDTIRGYSELHEEIFSGAGAAVAQAQVVFRRPALIAMAFDHNREVRIGRKNATKKGGVRVQGLTRVVSNIALVIIEICIAGFVVQPLRARAGRYF